MTDEELIATSNEAAELARKIEQDDLANPDRIRLSQLVDSLRGQWARLEMLSVTGKK